MKFRNRTPSEPLSAKDTWLRRGRRFAVIASITFGLTMFFGILAIWTDDVNSRFENTAALLLVPLFVFGVVSLTSYILANDFADD